MPQNQIAELLEWTQLSACIQAFTAGLLLVLIYGQRGSL